MSARLSCVGSVVGKVIGWWMMLRVIIRHVSGAFVPVESELPLCFSAPEPMDLHPNHFDATLNYCVIDESCGCGVVSLDG